MLATLCSRAQTLADSVYTVSSSEVVVQREKAFNAGTYTWKADSILLAQYAPNTLGDVLGQQTGMFVRQYTPGTLATPIMRGTYGVHTNVVWNGFSLQSPMNQLIDFNLIPAFFMDAVELAHGSQSALYGSGAIGGTIGLGQQAQTQNGLHGTVLLGTGSFGSYQQGVKLGYKKGWYTGRVRYFNQTAQNNFTYTNKTKFGLPTETLKNAQNWLNGQMIENYFSIKHNIKASLTAWHTQAYRGVAPLMFQEKSIAFQRDDSWRVMGDIKAHWKKSEGIVRAQYFDERIRYTDDASAVPINSDNRAFGLLLEGEFRYHVSPLHDVNFGINSSTFKSTADNYGTPAPVQYRPSVFASHRFHSSNKKIFTTFSIRQEAVTLRNTQNYPLLPTKLPGELRFLPIVPSFGADYNFYHKFWLGGKLSRVYRYPSFNDLYWSPGGNPNLKPEDGISGELRLSYKKENTKWAINTSVGSYYSDINNWIIWMQGQGGIWTPRNIQRVVARGIEVQTDVKYTINQKQYLKFDGRYAYTQSTNRKQGAAFDDSYNKQLIYVPHHVVATNISYGNSFGYLRISRQYTGKQFITSDNKRALPAFKTLNVFLGTKIKVQKTGIDINLQAKNILDAEYQAVEWAPMPQRNFLLNVQFNF